MLQDEPLALPPVIGSLSVEVAIPLEVAYLLWVGEAGLQGGEMLGLASLSLTGNQPHVSPAAGRRGLQTTRHGPSSSCGEGRGLYLPQRYSPAQEVPH